MDSLQQTKAEILSRANSLNGNYNLGNFGLKTHEIRNYNGTPGELKRRADQVDRYIRQFASEGKNVRNPEIMRELSQLIQENPAPHNTFLGGLLTFIIAGAIALALISLM